ncbi:acyltransferase family protein [Jiella sp. M17.18]|uniref:acyltransferase family protein n=1 Tax=Jiella sp. M17.18 TaxID=3234247 RepID=UPI0034DF6A9D
MHYRIFDCWRFLAALLIMAYHFVYSAPYGAQAGADFLHRLLPLLDMFFMISGYLITTRYAEKLTSFSSYGTFLRRRVARLYPLHVLITLFFAAVAVFAMLIGAPHYGWRHDLEALPAHLLVLHALGTTDGLALNYVSWSISAEFFSYALFPVVVLSLRRWGLRGLLLVLAVWIGALELASWWGVFPSGHWTTADSMGAYRAFADFMIGGFLAEVVRRRLVRLNSHWPGVVLIVAAVAAMLLRLSYPLVFSLLAAALTTTALAETEAPDSTAFLEPLMPLARVSFGIYIWHPVMEFFFLTVLWDRIVGPMNLVGFYVYWTLPMIASIAAALLSARYLEPPLARLVAGPSRRGRQPEAVSVAPA